ncbi:MULTISPECIES: type II toxin-antitoxin system PemK/MazF family toxin [unclassified Pseudonocardia]|uniref:type II toxin-antitoxin system PemK/MazF family toxin n=1 Tax=unclassified Pseudonocardia TaxID=2619320 RepID=UPI001CF63232|nr:MULTISPECIES: type II toxin-antitoxin system PemK/MazF family toxin [unclassified Pseudonocardia]
MSRDSIQPGAVWFVDFDPVRGREQGKDRPALVVSSSFHLELTAGQLVSVLPLTSVARPGWLHRVRLGDGWAITEQVRTVAAQRFRRPAPELAPAEDELAEVRRVLARMLTI